MIAVVIIAGFVVLGFLVYSPIKGKVSGLRGDLTNIDSQIKQIETTVDPHRTVEEERKILEERCAKLNSKFPAKEEESLRMLSDFARKMNISVLSTRSQPKTSFLDADKQKVEISGKICQKILVTMEMKGSYKDFLKYLETLKESLPAYLTIERLRMSKDSSGMPVLNINLDINLYLLS